MPRIGKFLIFVLFLAAPAFGADIYVGQSSAGGNTGADCADQRASSSLVAGDFVAGNTIHLCGTFTFGTNSHFLTVLGSGSSGSPITIKWESGAIVQASYFNNTTGGIEVNGNSWITLDGGSNGVIKNTANGTGLANQQQSSLIHSSGGSNVTITNLTIGPVYQHTINDSSGGTTYGIFMRHVSNLTVGPTNTISQADVGFLYEWDGGESNLVITRNSWTGINQDIEMGPTAGVAFTNVQVDHNTCGDWNNWDEPTNGFHHNFYHPFTNVSGASLTGTLQIYDNNCQGNMGSHATSMIFLENNNGGAGGTMGSWTIFNNIFNKTNANVPTSSGVVAVNDVAGSLYNNTFLDAGGSGGNAYVAFHNYTSGRVWTVTNNIFSGYGYMIYDQGSGVTGNDNVYYNSPSGTPWIRGSTFISTIAAWRTACSCDSASVTTNPNLDSSLKITSGSSAIGLGSNLTGVGITALNSDIAGSSRPSSGAWDSGAYNSGGASGPIITTSSLPNGTQGSAYSQTVSATGGTVPYTWSISVGTLPTGLSINSSSGVISGTPTGSGTSSFTVQVTDNASLTGTQVLSITINVPGTVAFSTYGGEASSAGSVSSLTFTLGTTIVSGSNLAARVDVIWHDASATISGVTWGGVAMSAACSLVRNGSETAQIWVLAAPATGTPSIVVTFSATVTGNIHADGLTYTGVNQSTVVRSATCNSATGSTTTSTLTVTSQAGDMTGTVLSQPRTINSTNQTQRTLDNTGTDGMGTDDAAGSGTVTHTWTSGGVGTWALEGFSIQAASGAPPPNPPSNVNVIIEN